MKKSLIFLFCLTLLFFFSACKSSGMADDLTSADITTTASENTTAETNATSTTKPENDTAPTDEKASSSAQPTTPLPKQPAASEATEPTERGIVARGNCGFGFEWKLSEDGTFTICGNGRPEGRTSNYPWKDYAYDVKKVVVEDGITHVPQSAFFNLKNLTEVVLADSVKTIAKDAFSNCTALEKITIPPLVEQLESGTFAGCSSLKSIDFAPNSQLHTLNSAWGPSGLTEFVAPPNLKVIKSRAFVSHLYLETVILNGSLETIEPQAFVDCSALKKVVLGSSITSIGNYAFNGCTTITHYESYAPMNITLSGLPHLKTVIIGGDVTTIPQMTHCTSLHSVSITSPIVELDSNHFMGCSSLSGITLPETITEIDNYAFVGAGIQKLTIPASVKKMGLALFNKSPLQEITFTGDPPVFDSNITDGTFSGIDKLTAYYPANNPAWTDDVLQNYGAGEIIWIAK